MTFGEKLQALRKARNMTQEQLALELSVSRQAVSKWELDDAVPETENIVQLSRLFGVTTDYLLFEVPPSPAAPPEAAAPAQTVEIAAPAAPSGKGRRIAGWVLTGLGGLGFIVIWVLSTMIQGFVDVTYQDSTGATWWTTKPGYSFGGFVEKYRLEAIIGVCIVCLILGIVLLLWRFLTPRNFLDDPEPAGPEP